MPKNVRSKNARRKKFARNRISKNVTAQKVNDHGHQTKSIDINVAANIFSTRSGEVTTRYDHVGMTRPTQTA